jgi:hypothetical protein
MMSVAGGLARNRAAPSKRGGHLRLLTGALQHFGLPLELGGKLGQICRAVSRPRTVVLLGGKGAGASGALAQIVGGVHCGLTRECSIKSTSRRRREQGRR